MFVFLGIVFLLSCILRWYTQSMSSSLQLFLLPVKNFSFFPLSLFFTSFTPFTLTFFHSYLSIWISPKCPSLLCLPQTLPPYLSPPPPLWLFISSNPYQLPSRLQDFLCDGNRLWPYCIVSVFLYNKILHNSFYLS